MFESCWARQLLQARRELCASGLCASRERARWYGAWSAIGNPGFKAVLEAWLAMANDPSLRAEIAPVVAGFATLVRPDAKPSILSDDEHRDFYLMARETMLGLALGRATNGGRPVAHERTVLARLRADAAAIDAHTARGGRR